MKRYYYQRKTGTGVDVVGPFKTRGGAAGSVKSDVRQGLDCSDVYPVEGKPWMDAQLKDSETHTPNPLLWNVTGDPCVPGRVLVERRDSGYKSLIADFSQCLGHGGTAEGNARFVLRACQSFGPLVDAVKHAAKLSRATLADLRAEGYAEDSAQIGAETWNLNRFEAALRAAERNEVQS